MQRSRGEASPHAILGGILIGVVLYLIGEALWSPSADEIRVLNLTLAVIVLALALVSIVGRERLGETWIVIVLIAGDVMIAVSAAMDVSSEGQLVSGVFLLLVGVFSAFYLPWRRFLLVLLVGVVGYVAGLIANPIMATPQYALLVVLLAVAVSLTVAHQSQRIAALVRTDPLTGALNRRGLEEEAMRARSLAEREGRGASVVVIDLDGFKALNDQLGHHVGDDILVTAVRDWTAELRQGDVLARTGGDEFVIVLPRTALPDVTPFIERLRDLNDIRWTFGCAEWRPGEELATALVEADRAMYDNKPDRG